MILVVISMTPVAIQIVDLKPARRAQTETANAVINAMQLPLERSAVSQKVVAILQRSVMDQVPAVLLTSTSPTRPPARFLDPPVPLDSARAESNNAFHVVARCRSLEPVKKFRTMPRVRCLAQHRQGIAFH